MITDIEDYFIKGCGRCARFDTRDCSANLWRDGLRQLRQICLEVGLTETLKWAHPCCVHKTRNIAIMGAFRDDFRLSFFNPSLMQDAENILEKQGANSAHKDMIRFTDNNQPTRMKPIIIAYLDEAKGYAEANIKPEKVKTEIAWPDELAEAFEADIELADAFHALTPGRQKSYLINLNGAKKTATRIARIAKFRDKIIAGKGAQEY